MTLGEINKRISELGDEYGESWQKLSPLESELKKFPSNNQLRKKSYGNKEKFERLKYERDLQTKELREEIERIESRQEQIKEEIKSLKELPPYIEFVWQTEGKIELEKNLSEDMLQHLEEEGYSKDFLFERAKTSSLAREILTCYETPTYGRGYVDYSMSYNAYVAQENRQKPLSKWNREDLAEFHSLFGVKTTLKKLKDFLLTFGEAGYHHTSKFYNETKHYSLPLAILNSSKEQFVSYFGEIKNFTLEKK